MSKILSSRRFSFNPFRRKNEQGATLIEAAIVLLPLMIVMFGIVEYGFVYKNSLTLSHAARSGARIASSLPEDPNYLTQSSSATIQAASGASFKNGDTIFIYKANAQGLPASGNINSCTNSCQAWTFNNGSWTKSGGLGWSHTTHKACTNAPMDNVGVAISLTHTSLTNFFPFINNMKLQEKSVMRLEPVTHDCA